MQGLVFNVQRFSIHDGPGIRTTFFLKGCPLRCFWCHNPEGVERRPQVQFFHDLCIGCGECLKACPNRAHGMAGGRHELDRSACTACGRCIASCPARALVMAGRPMEAAQAEEEALRDAPFFRSSGGGVTLSGGEPLLQKEFCGALLARCREAGVHTAVETAGLYPWTTLEDMLPVTDLLLMDIKHMDPGKHKWATGAENAVILENARRAARTGVPMVLRVPVIPTVNDTVEEVEAIRDFVRTMRDGGPRGASVSLELLGFHPLALDKYESLGMDNPSARLSPIGGERMEELRAAARLDG